MHKQKKNIPKKVKKKSKNDRRKTKKYISPLRRTYQNTQKICQYHYQKIDEYKQKHRQIFSVGILQ